MTAQQEAPYSVAALLGHQNLAKEQQSLLDLIDKIQHAQIEGIRLPRIVVVGDQSAGKSSVLEAITGIPFPRDAGACTRFATEIRLRRAKEEKFHVEILPDVTRSPQDRDRLQRFAASVTAGADFEQVMRRAVAEIAPHNIAGRFAAKDVLVVEKWGPGLPLLTVVDLPGLVNVVNKDQSEDDVRAIDDLTNRYMRSSRTIILAIIGGNSDFVQQKVLMKAKQFDPTGARTIGVLTKPDVTREIGLEDKFIALVNNQDPHNRFRLGWFVLRNPGPHDLGRQWTAEERQAQEDEFFSEGKWSALPASMRGAANLKQKLSQQLMRHIARYVPKLRKEIQEKLVQTDSELKKLGRGKDTPAEMREDLVLLSSTSKQLVTPAVDGTYKNPAGKRFFPQITKRTDPSTVTPPQNLRARVVKENERFAKRVREQGHHLNLISSSGSGSLLQPTLMGGGNISKEQYAREVVEPFIEENMGTEFRGDYNPRLVYRLFHEFSENWSLLAQEHRSNLGIICNEFLAEVIEDVWPQHMREKLRTLFLDPQMSTLLENAKQEVERLANDQQYEVQSYDPEYEERLREWRKEASSEERQYTTAEELLEKSLIHYDLSAKTFISNVIVQCIERHLLQGLDEIFSPVKVTRMTDQEIEDIALESIEIRERRAKLLAAKKAIEESLEICNNVAMRKELRAFAGESFNDLDNDSDDENFGTTPKAQKPQTARMPVAESAQLPHRASQQQPAAPHAYVEPDWYTNGIPDPSAPAIHLHADERGGRMPGDWDDYRASQVLQNPYAPPTAPHHTPPPPPPRPAKVPGTEAGMYDAPPSPAESFSKSPAASRHAYSTQDLIAGRLGMDDGTPRKSARKISSILRGQT